MNTDTDHRKKVHEIRGSNPQLLLDDHVVVIEKLSDS